MFGERKGAWLRNFFFKRMSILEVSGKIHKHLHSMMTSKFPFSTIFALGTSLTLLALSACGPDKEAIVREKVAERVSDFVLKKRTECREALLTEAEKTVDSLLLTEAQNDLNDSLARLRPGRPFQPAPVPPIDSLQVKPIFGGNR